MPVLGYIVLIVCAYLLGSIPTGYLVARAKGIDIRTVGSGNIGATNAFRVLGTPAGIFVLLVDALKGYAACIWMTDLLLRAFGAPTDHARARAAAPAAPTPAPRSCPEAGGPSPRGSPGAAR